MPKATITGMSKSEANNKPIVEQYMLTYRAIWNAFKLDSFDAKEIEKLAKIAEEGTANAIRRALELEGLICKQEPQNGYDGTMARALADGPLKYADLVDKVMEVAGIKTMAAKNRIKDAADAGIIQQDPVYKKFRYVGLDMENEKDCPF